MSLYRTLLRLYPASFRAEYGAELTRTFEEAVQHRGRATAMLAAAADVLPNAAAAHAELLRQDLGYAARSLRNAPGFAITAMLVIALGVGANTAAFSLADFVLLKPFPYPESHRLVRVFERAADNSYYGDMSPANFRDWQREQRSFAAMGAFTYRPANLVSDAEPRRVEIVRATPEVLPLLGVAPLVGQPFAPEDTLSGQAIMLSHALWQSQFGGDPGIAGTFVRLDGVPHRVAGVMPASFRFPNQGVEAWAPLVLTPPDFEDRGNQYLFGVARLRNGVTRIAAGADLDGIAERIERTSPMDADGTRTDGTRAAVWDLRGEIAARDRTLVLALCGAALCILLLACANLASLFLARGSYRARELAVRAALGAGRERLVRQLVTESMVLAALGGALGIVVAMAGVPLLGRLVPSGLPMLAQPSVDLRVLAVAIVLLVFTGLAFGIAPAIRAGASNALDALRAGARAGGGRTQRLRAGLVIVEVAASVVLLASSGLLVRAVWRVQAIDPGFAAENALALRTALPLPKYDTVSTRIQFYDRVLSELRTIPGVQSAAYVTGLPLEMRGGIRGITVPGRPAVNDAPSLVSYRFATEQYFSALGIPFRRGRDFTSGDTRGALPVAIVSESFVERHWPGEDALGQLFLIAGEEEPRSIAGIVGDVRVRGLERQSEPQVYLPPGQVADGATSYAPKDLVVRAAGAPEALLPRIRAIVQAADPEQPTSNVRLLSQIVAAETAPRTTQLRILIAFSVIALLIAGLGIHGLLTFTVSKRSQELGVRRALGAQASGIVRLVASEGLVLAAAGIAIGLPIAYAAARGMSAVLSGVRPEDPLTLGIAAALCFATAVLGCLRPAARAARVDPLSALRSE